MTCDPRTRSSTITHELVNNANIRLQSRVLWAGPCYLCYTSSTSDSFFSSLDNSFYCFLNNLSYWHIWWYHCLNFFQNSFPQQFWGIMKWEIYFQRSILLMVKLKNWTQAPSMILMQVLVWEALKEDIQTEVGERPHSITACDQHPKRAFWMRSFDYFFLL